MTRNLIIVHNALVVTPVPDIMKVFILGQKPTRKL